MTDKDVLFKKVDNTTNVDLSSFCYFGWEGTGAFAFYKYACAYYDSAVSLYEKIQNSNGHYDIVDGLGIAMCFTYRHYTELMIKHLYVKFVCKDEADYKRFLSIGHNLVELWNNTKPKLKELKDRVGSSVSLGVVEHYIKQINAFDKESMSMRYPIDKKLSPMHPQTRLDLANLVERMNELYFAFEALAHDLDNQLNCEMDQEEITAFLAVYESLKPRVKQILIDLAKYAKKDKEIQMFHLGTFEDLQIEEDSSWNYLKGLTDERLVLFQHNAVLVVHDNLFAVVFGAFVQPVFKSCRRCAFLCRIGEAAEAVEFRFVDKYGKLFKFFFSLTGEARDKGRAKDNIGDAFTQLLNQFGCLLGGTAAIHALQNFIACVL